jgi:acetyltransferase-like isoleucine patch superfamily enzyme
MKNHPSLKQNGKNHIFFDQTVTFGLNVNIEIEGNGNSINIARNVVLRNINILIIGDNNQLIIDEGCNLRGAIHLRQKNSAIQIGKMTTWVGAHLFAMEGKSIIIGDDCMFSSGVYIRNSDEHSIFDLSTDTRVNKAQDVVIENHVWICEGVTISKGSFLANGCVVGAKSLVATQLKKTNAIYAGVPAKLIRENIYWDRKLVVR